MSKKLVEEVPASFKDKLPVNVFFVEGKEQEAVRQEGLVFASSDFYITRSMRCYNFYKPAIL